MNYTHDTIEESTQSRKRPRPPDGGAPPSGTSPSSDVPPEVMIAALKRKLLEMVREADQSKATNDSLDAALGMEKREHRLKTVKLTTLIHQKQELNHKNQTQEADLRSLRDTVSQLQMQVQSLTTNGKLASEPSSEIQGYRESIAELQAQNKTLKEVKIEQFNQKMDQLEKQNQHLRALLADWCTKGAASDTTSASTPAAPASVQSVASKQTEAAAAAAAAEAAAVELIRLTSSEARPPTSAAAPAVAPAVAPASAPAAVAPAIIQAAPVVAVSVSPAISGASADKNTTTGLSVQIPPAVSRVKSGTLVSPQQAELTPTAQPAPHVAVPHVAAPARAAVAASTAALKNAEPRVITTSAPARTASVLVNNKSTTTTSRRYFVSDAAQVADSSGNARRSLLMGEATPYGYAKGAIYVV